MPQTRFLIGSFQSTVGEFLAQRSSNGWDFLVLHLDQKVQMLEAQKSQVAADLTIMRQDTGFAAWDDLDSKDARAQMTEKHRWRYYEIPQKGSDGGWIPAQGETSFLRTPPRLPE